MLELLFILTISLLSLGQLLLEIDETESVENMLKIGIGAFALLLLSLSISAYRKTGLRKIIYASIAFALFAIQLFFDFLEDTVESFDTPYNDIVFYAMTLAILILFFMAIVRRR
jgi:hypothetical protein